ncbi:MAG: ATP-binding protein, partial [Actinomycetota bacterium]|nr:ATP-binding protein [Actinomycetota bacterium]
MEESLPVSHGAEASALRSARRPLPLKLYLAGVALPVLAYLVAQAATRPDLQQQLRAGAPWIVVLFFIEMFPIPVWRDVRVSLGFMMVLFLGVLFDPAAVALFVLIGSGDPREFTGAADLLRAVFNRCQIALAALASTATLHAIAPDATFGPIVLGAALVASVVNLGLNMTLVAGAAHLDYGTPVRDVLRRMVLGSSWPLQGLYLGLGLLGVAMALVYREVGAWALAGLVPPLLAIRPLLTVSHRLRQAEAHRDRETALNRVAEQIAGERRRERERLASILHDELSPLLASAKLRLDAALGTGSGPHGEPAEEIRSGLTAAHGHVRSLIKELLDASPKAEGLLPTLRMLFAELRAEHRVVVMDACRPVQASHPVDELLYSIAREAARNALRHGGAKTLRVSLEEEDGEAILVVADDGIGFDPAILNRTEGKFGLTLLRRRAKMCGGVVSVSSSPGQGTVVTARIPLSAEA